MKIRTVRRLAMIRNISLVVMLIGLISVVVGAVFVGLGFYRNNQLVEAMRSEQVRLNLEEGGEPQLIDSASEAQAAGDVIREHRRGIAPTYQDLLGDGRFDPTNPEHLSYAQALNMENYLYLAVMGFGLIQAVQGSGVFMILTGVAFGGIGLVLYRLRNVVV
jgi:hypothetical protein